MSKDTERYTSYNEYKAADAMSELSPEDQELAQRIENRRRRSRRGRLRKKWRTVIIMILIFAALLTMCGREIVRLKAENLSLQRQHALLEQERDRLSKELENVSNKEYIKDQARKQLRLLDPGEIVFIFDDGDIEAAAEAEAEEKARQEAEEKTLAKTVRKEERAVKAIRKGAKKAVKEAQKAEEERIKAEEKKAKESEKIRKEADKKFRKQVKKAAREAEKELKAQEAETAEKAGSAEETGTAEKAAQSDNTEGDSGN